MIYLDNAATTFPKPKEVYESLDYSSRSLSFNAGRGAYKESVAAEKVILDFKLSISKEVNASLESVSILSSATEAFCILINGINFQDGDNVYISPFEHNAIVRALYNIKEKIDINIFILDFDKKTWLPELKKINDKFIIRPPKLVLISQVSNVTGLMIDYSPIFRLSKRNQAINILDSAQSFGILPIKEEFIDFIVFAGHKSMYGPFGVGGFINLTNCQLKIIKAGGTGSDSLNHFMPEQGGVRFESGSQNVPAIYSTLTGYNWVKTKDIFEHEKEITLFAINKLKDNKKIHCFLPQDINNVFGIISFSVEGYTAEEVGQILDEEYDICVRTGYHCSPFVHEFINSTNNGGTVRISFSYFTKEEDIIGLIEALNTL